MSFLVLSSVFKISEIPTWLCFCLMLVILENRQVSGTAHERTGLIFSLFQAMNGQYLCNRQITVSYAYKKDTKGERHGTPAGEVHIYCLLGLRLLPYFLLISITDSSW